MLQGLSSLGSYIVDGLSGILNGILDGITNLPNLLLNGIKLIFIPDYNIISDTFSDFTESIGEKFGFNTSFFDKVLTDEEPVTDVEGDYNISGVGNLHLTFFDSSYLVQGVEFFRPIIRGFLVLLLAFFHIKSILSFIRQDAGVVTGKVANSKEE